MTRTLIAETPLGRAVKVVTVDDLAEHENVGVHAALKSFVIGVPDIDATVPVATYLNAVGAQLGHEQVVAETQRTLFQRRAVQRGWTINTPTYGVL